MTRIRKCNRRCHEAKGKRCGCWCKSAFHGTAGAENRQSIQEGNTDLLKQHGFQKDKTAYINQTAMVLDQEGGEGHAGN